MPFRLNAEACLVHSEEKILWEKALSVTYACVKQGIPKCLELALFLGIYDDFKVRNKPVIFFNLDLR